MKGFLAPVLVAIGALSASPLALAGTVGVGLATISEVNGVVLVSDGGRFSTAAEGGYLVKGNRLLTMESAAATVTYGDGCQVEVAPNTMVVFRQADECSAGTIDSKAAGRQYASLGAPTSAAAASAGTVATTTAAVNTTGAMGGSRRAGAGEPGFLGVPAAGVIAGAGFVGVIAYFGISDSNNNDNDRRVSPAQ